MLSDKENILQLVALMKAHGIEDVVLCPGSRNAPIVHTISQLSEFRCHAITDERSAGFFATGLALATGKPAAVCVTSGSALLNLHPAASEAFYQQVPLVIISADRPAAWIGQMDGQTLPQPGALGSMVKMSVQLTENDKWFNNRMLNEALLECTHRTKGPVHINVPITEPFYKFHTEQLPNERIIRRIEGIYPQQIREIADLLNESSHRLIIIGQKPTDRQISPSLMHELNRGYVSLCEHLGNCGEGSIALSITDALVEGVQASTDLQPDLVITCCGHIVNKKLKQWLRKNPPRQHWHISPDGSVVDLFGCLTTVIEAQPYQFLQALAYMTIRIEETDNYTERWTELAIKAKKASSTDTPEAHAVRQLVEQLPDNAVLHLANSSSVRLALNYALPKGVTVCCNRGVNGIEGSLSSAVGYATATPDRPNFVVIGDLSFFYDQNALWNRELPKNLHILLLNNGGGAIFNTLPIPDDERSRQFIMAHHCTTAEHVAQQYGLCYQHNPENLTEFINSKKSILCEIGNR